MILSIALVAATWAASPPAGFIETSLRGYISEPTAMEFSPDGRLFICEQTGALRVFKYGALLDSPFVKLTVDSEGERGLLGVAVDPDFPSNQFLYLYYTHPGPPLRNVVVRFTADGDQAAPGSETLLLETGPFDASNHNGGAIHFGLDGKLYIAIGENARPDEAQSLNTLLGKILRLNPDGSVPSDNPFAQRADIPQSSKAIWAYGLRNPFTFAIHPGSGRIFLNDVGWETEEEINEIFPGANYGWPKCEGPCENAAFVNPVYSYSRALNLDACAITGGAFYHPAVPNFPASFHGLYFFSDTCAGWIRTLHPDTRAVSGFSSGGIGIVDLKVGIDGSLYYLQRGGGVPFGEVRRISFATPPDYQGAPIPPQ